MARDGANSEAGRTRKGFPPATATEVDAGAGGTAEPSANPHALDDKTKLTPTPTGPGQNASVIVEELRVSDLVPLDSASDSNEGTPPVKARDAAKLARRPSHRDFVDLPEGSLVGEYEIERRIGQGGMGAVYSAVHPILGKRVAIKIIGDEISRDAGAIARFRREARAVAQLASPHIVGVFGFGELSDGRAYFVMEHLSGESLHNRLARGRVPLDEALELLEQVARGLEVAHEAGIVHRDLKPENIFIERGRNGPPIVKLLDFGLVKLVEQRDEAVTATQAGVMFGTPMYCSPEQIRSASNVDHRTDIYALGCVAYEMILGRVPFQRTTVVEMIAAHLECAPPQPRTLWPEIPTALDALLWAMVAKEPGKRPTLGYASETIEKVKRSAFATPTSAIAAFTTGVPVVMPPIVADQLNIQTTPVPPSTPPRQASYGMALGTRAIPTPLALPAARSQRSRRIAVIVAALGATIVAISIAAALGSDDPDPSAASPSMLIGIDASISIAPIEVEAPPALDRPDAAVTPHVGAPPIAKADALRARSSDAGVTPKPAIPVQRSTPGIASPPSAHATVDASPPRPADGELDITSKPPCDISIDGKAIGRHTPIVGLMLDAGMHTIRLVNDKYGIDETVYKQILPGKPALIKNDYSARMHVDPNGTIDPFAKGH